VTALLPAWPSYGHPVPSDNHDRTIVVRLTLAGVTVDYRLELDEARAAKDLPAEVLEKVTSRKDFYLRFCRYFGPILANNLSGRLDGKELNFRCEKETYEITDHFRCDFRFRADWNLKAGGKYQFTFQEGNYDLDDFSLLRISLEVSSQLTALRLEGPTAEVLGRAPSDRKPGEADQLRKVKATFTATPSVLPGVGKSALPPDLDPPPRKPTRREGKVAWGKPASSGWKASSRTPPGPSNEETETIESSSATHLLHLLLDTRKGFGILLLLAAGFGAAHALTPGHGKTLVAAYLVGEKGTVLHALVLGLVTTLTHTSAVLILAAILPLLFPKTAPASVQMVLGFVGGLLIAGLGVWLLLCRLTGRSDHLHLPGGHSHGGEATTETTPATKAVWSQLIVLGISGGIVPCWDALAMLGFAVSAQRLTLALPLLLAFSAGLASVLVAIGIGVVYARRFAVQRWSSHGRLERWMNLLPIASAILITILGLGLCYGSLKTQPPPRGNGNDPQISWKMSLRGCCRASYVWKT
jgi:ABC-type nickel/cobalt efflux system permease component RcnA